MAPQKANEKKSKAASVKGGPSAHTTHEKQTLTSLKRASADVSNEPQPARLKNVKGQGNPESQKAKVHAMKELTAQDSISRSSRDVTPTPITEVGSVTSDSGITTDLTEISSQSLTFRLKKPKAWGASGPMDRARRAFNSSRRQQKRRLDQLGDQLRSELAGQRKEWDKYVHKIIQDRMETSQQKLLYAHLHRHDQVTHNAQVTQAWATVQTLSQQLAVVSDEVKDLKAQLKRRKSLKSDGISDEMVVDKWAELRGQIHDLARYLSRLELRLWPSHMLWRLQVLSNAIPDRQGGDSDAEVTQHLKAYLWHVVYTAVFRNTSTAWDSEPRATLSELKMKMYKSKSIQRDHMKDLEQWLLDGVELLEHASSGPVKSRVLEKLVESETHSLSHHLVNEDIGVEIHAEIANGVKAVFTTALQLHQMMLSSRGVHHVSMERGRGKYDESRMNAIDGLETNTTKVKLVVSPLVIKESLSTGKADAKRSALVKAEVVCMSKEDLFDEMVQDKRQGNKSNGERERESRSGKKQPRRRTKSI